MHTGLSWLQHYSVAYCLTFAQDLDATELLRRFNADLAQAQWIQGNDQELLNDMRWFGAIAQAGQKDGWAFVYEDNGYQGTMEHILRTVSTGSTTFSLFHNVNAVTRFCYAKDRTIIAHFDTIDPPFNDPSSLVQDLLQQAQITQERIQQGDYDFGEALFALAEGTGVHLEREDLESGPLLTTFLRNPVSDFFAEALLHKDGDQVINHLLRLFDLPAHRQQLFNLLSIWQQRNCPRLVATRVESMLEALYTTPAIEELLALLAAHSSSSQVSSMPTLRSWRQYDGSTSILLTELLKALIHFAPTYSGPDQREKLLLLTSASEPEIMCDAALALGELGDLRAIGPLVHILTHFPDDRATIQMLGQLRAQEAIEPLLQLLSSPNQEIDLQRAVLQALVQIGDERIAERLLPLLRPQSQWALLEELERRYSAQSTQAPQGTFYLKPQGSHDRSHNRLLHENTFQRELLATLGKLGNAQVSAALLLMLKPHPRIGYTGDFSLALITTLGELGDPEAREALALLLNPNVHLNNWKMQQALVKTLRQLGDTSVELQAVEEALQRVAEEYHRQTEKWLDGKPSTG